MKHKIGFVILHYLAKEETINCVSSIKEKVGTEDYLIVIVDNASSNGSGNELLEKYENDSKVKVLINRENLGFAKGMNVGFQCLKSGGYKFIVLLNNDILLLTDNFYDHILKEYENSKFALMGPEIHDLNNKIFYYSPDTPNLKSEKKSYILLKVLLLMARIKVLKLISILANKNNASKIHPIREYEQDVLIHGCCLIFSEEYINIFDGLDDRTFLYGEEPLLYLRLKKHKLLSVYNPDLKIKHLEDISTNYSIPDFNKRREMQYKNMITSCKIIISELKK